MQIVLDKLTESLKTDTKAAGGVVVDENDTLTILFYQSGIMRNTFSKFPKIMFIDGTYNVNELEMPLYCLMVEDCYGHGQNVFYAATAREDAIHLQKIVELFKSNNTDWGSVRVIIVDQDFWNIKCLASIRHLVRHLMILLVLTESIAISITLLAIAS